ncbi:hypothetical protein [Natrinema thermotolerans]|uniref:hypothetical protein n=1 Tax=Natrinema thermotolerans TaxID=121872 RepID=UPI0006791C99|nr:hypothetical protein [Natrinema thermotolerans]QCC57224.1 hypothetical protein DVR14_00695 [Natrinema thermotolerans]
MSDGVLPRRDGMPIDVWAVTWLLSLFILLTGAGAVFYVAGIGGITTRDLVVWLAETGVLGTYYAARVAIENHGHIGDGADPETVAFARSHRNRWITIATGSAVVTVALALSLVV